MCMGLGSCFETKKVNIHIYACILNFIFFGFTTLSSYIFYILDFLLVLFGGQDGGVGHGH